jgi:type I restriction enzyme S subunit
MMTDSVWPQEEIRGFASIGTGAKDTKDRVVGGKYPFFVRSQNVERINTWSFDGEAVLTAGDGVGTGKVFHYIDGKFDYHQRVYRISNFRPDVMGRYFFHQFSRNFLARIESLTAKSSVDSVRMETIAGMRIPVPGRREQERIVEAIDDAGALVTALERLVAKKQAMKQGMMQELLIGSRRLPGFTEDWSIKTFGELGTFFKGRGVKRDDVQLTGVPCVRYGELYTDFVNYTATTRSFVSAAVAATASPIRCGDLLFAGSGETREEIGICVAYVGAVPAVAGGDIVVLRGSSFNPVYLATLANTPIVANQKARLGQGDAVVHISSRSLSTMTVTLPSKPEQDAIAQVLIDSDDEINALHRRLTKARDVKAGMMQELLTGRVRLPVADVAA